MKKKTERKWAINWTEEISCDAAIYAPTLEDAQAKVVEVIGASLKFDNCWEITDARP